MDGGVRERNTFFCFKGVKKKINEKNVGNLATDVRSVRQRECKFLRVKALFTLAISFPFPTKKIRKRLILI